MADRLDAGEDRATWFRSLFEAIFTRRFVANPASIDAALHWALDYPYPQSPAAFRRQCEAMAAFDGRADLIRIERPTLVVAGREDILFPPERCAAFAARLPGAKLVVLDGAAHAGAHRAAQGVRRRRRGIPARVNEDVRPEAGPATTSRIGQPARLARRCGRMRKLVPVALFAVSLAASVAMAASPPPNPQIDMAGFLADAHAAARNANRVASTRRRSSA
jgi:fermentation-respiration switch protein FrsA (DUF1100 family)